MENQLLCTSLRALVAFPPLLLCLQVEVGTLAPRPKDPVALPTLGAVAEPLNPQPPSPPAPIPAQGECGPLGAAQRCTQWGLVSMGCSHTSQGWQGWCSAAKGANPFATSRQEQLFAQRSCGCPIPGSVQAWAHPPISLHDGVLWGSHAMPRAASAPPGLPSCLLCLCIGTSVYCDDADLEHIPLLPPETTYLYARFNRIGAIRASDFTGLKKLKRIDLSSNFISWADADAFHQLSSLQELLLPQNQLTALPELPRSIIRLDARLNRIPSTGLRHEAFRDLKQLQFLHLSDNQLDYIPAPLPQSLRSLHLQNNNIQTMHEDTFCDSQDHSQIRRALEDIRLDGNPINLGLFPNAYFCLPRLPTGRFS
uniref:Opticin n=1 Tax=Strigops habroptila TaxID=2489341 RepID=A0A672UK88_STRHB